MPYAWASNNPLHRQLLQQRLRLLEVERVEPLSEPPVHRRQQFARLLHLALVTPETREAHGGAEFPGFGLLFAGDRESALEMRFCFGGVGLRQHQSDFASNAIDLSLPPPFLGCFYVGNRFFDAPPCFVELAKFCIGFRQI